MTKLELQKENEQLREALRDLVAATIHSQKGRGHCLICYGPKVFGHVGVHATYCDVGRFIKKHGELVEEIADSPQEGCRK